MGSAHSPGMRSFRAGYRSTFSSGSRGLRTYRYPRTVPPSCGNHAAFLFERRELSVFIWEGPSPCGELGTFSAERRGSSFTWDAPLHAEYQGLFFFFIRAPEAQHIRLACSVFTALHLECSVPCEVPRIFSSERRGGPRVYLRCPSPCGVPGLLLKRLGVLAEFQAIFSGTPWSVAPSGTPDFLF